MLFSSLVCDISKDVELEVLTSFIWKDIMMMIRIEMKIVLLNQYIIIYWMYSNF